MSESIFIRVQRVLSAGADSAASLAERASGASLMRQAIREVDAAAGEVRARRERAEDRRVHAATQQQVVHDRLATLEDQAKFALSKGREDLAEAAVSRQLDFEAEVKRLKQVQAEAAEEISRLEQSLAELKVRKAQMEKDLDAFESARGAAAAGAPTSPEARARRRAERAEEAFERAMEAAGGPGVGLMDAEAAARVAEVDQLQREASVAERMQALREASAKGGVAKAGKGAGKRGR